ncbi:MAG: isopeptide-forming domain-containing fimbrial protein [Clostridia bacterium]|nr:isopeptide-forming domain-containing fimbrial protein [Clostridia bacterium]
MSAFATSIKITPAEGYNPDDNTVAETYHAYKIFSAVTPSGYEGVNDDNIETAKTSTDVGFQYKLSGTTDPWYTAVNASGYFDFSTQSDGSIIATLKSAYNADASTAQAIATALKPYTKDVDATNGINWNYNLTLNTAQTVDDGYYLIVSSLGEKLVLATADIEITEKNTYPGVDKTQKDLDDGSAYIDATLDTHDNVSVAVGDEISYQVKVTIPATINGNIVVTDTMSAGLTFDKDAENAITADKGTKDTDWAITSSSAQGWVITISPTTAMKAAGDITFTFKAKVNSSAVVADTTRRNSVKLEYSNFEQNDYVPFELKSAAIYKYDGNTSTALEGVVFTLKEGDTEFPVSYDATNGYYYYDAENGSADISTGDDGMIIIRGLDGDKAYTLTEKTPKPGYNTLSAPVSLTLQAIDFEFTTSNADQVENNKGAELPSTGGIGTTIFYVAGSIMVLAAAILLITKRRMGAND